jgi:hypothetical protein
MASNRDIDVWLVPVEHAHVVVPFRVSIRTQAGVAIVDATEFHIAPTELTSTAH